MHRRCGWFGENHWSLSNLFFTATIYLKKRKKKKKKGEKGPKLSKELWLVVIKKEEEGLGYISGVQCR